ncbi:DUF5337 domain-containing protein [Anianabacter salinae]|uniref:DUF5337 domain-containing protein n=1 Tax=Anianabacter salinae TaxID=2851023 RepID=UPI00225DED53|nr:DUF5337 domain-containing protein [Anianabacter salinae]MBV0911434.1 DUF5337 domain-containing protein [Anianabacter salinae]
MTQGSDKDRELARQARIVALVIAATMIVWMAGTWIGGAIGLPARYAFLFDFAALAGFVWAMVVTYQIWRKRRDNEG